LIAQGISFCFETVFSHESKIDLIGQAMANGYTVILVYIHLFDSSLNEARVRQRVSEGGHSVPVEKIYTRIPRTVKHIKTALAIVDEARILDNSSRQDPFKQLIVMKRGRFEINVDPLPQWATDLLPA
jgi:predicted ABC-type ATPase